MVAPIIPEHPLEKIVSLYPLTAAPAASRGWAYWWVKANSVDLVPNIWFNVLTGNHYWPKCGNYFRIKKKLVFKESVFGSEFGLATNYLRALRAV